MIQQVIPKSITYATKREKPAYQSQLSGTRNLTDTYASVPEDHITRQKPQIPPVRITQNTDSKKSHNSPMLSPVLAPETINELEWVQKKKTASVQTAVLSTTPQTTKKSWKQPTALSPPLAPRVMNESKMAPKPMVPPRRSTMTTSKNNGIGDTHHMPNYIEQSTGDNTTKKAVPSPLLVQDSSTGVKEPDCTVSLERERSDPVLLAISESLRMLIDKVDKIEKRQYTLERDVLQTKPQRPDEEGSIAPMSTTIKSMSQHDVSLVYLLLRVWLCT